MKYCPLKMVPSIMIEGELDWADKDSSWDFRNGLSPRRKEKLELMVYNLLLFIN